MNRRQTKQKQLIYEHMQGENVHKTAQQVYDEIKLIDQEIGLATVYRNLNLLSEEGKIRKISYEGFSVFDGNIEEHQHFKCLECGKIQDIHTDQEALNQAISKQVEGVVVKHTIYFEGICKECLGKKEKKVWN